MLNSPVLLHYIRSVMCPMRCPSYNGMYNVENRESVTVFPVTHLTTFAFSNFKQFCQCCLVLAQYRTVNVTRYIDTGRDSETHTLGWTSIIQIGNVMGCLLQLAGPCPGRNSKVKVAGINAKTILAVMA